MPNVGSPGPDSDISDGFVVGSAQSALTEVGCYGSFVRDNSSRAGRGEAGASVFRTKGLRRSPQSEDLTPPNFRLRQGSLAKSFAAIIPSCNLHPRRYRPEAEDLAAGHIDLTFSQPAWLPLLRAGTVKAYAVTSEDRLALAPDIPTFAEIGLPALSYSPWVGLFAPKATPKDIVVKLNAVAVGPGR